MTGPIKKKAVSSPSKKRIKKPKPQQQDDVLYSPEFLSSEEAMIQAEQEMSRLEVT